MSRDYPGADPKVNYAGCARPSRNAGHESPDRREVVAAFLDDHGREPKRAEPPPGLPVAVDGDEQWAVRVAGGRIDAECDTSASTPSTQLARSATAASQSSSAVPGASGRLRFAPAPAPAPSSARCRGSAGTSRHADRRGPSPSARRRAPRRSPARRCRGGRRRRRSQRVRRRCRVVAAPRSRRCSGSTSRRTPSG